MYLTNLTQSLSELHIVTIVWFAAILTFARILFLKMPGQAVRTLVEVIEAALIAGVLVFMVIQPFVVKAFYIPSGSMLPTLIEDDHILVNRFIYRVHGPDHGDVVVFNAPAQALEQGGETPDAANPTDYIKRCIGLPGDTIEVVAGTVTVNNQLFTHQDLRPDFGLTRDPTSLDEQHLKLVSDGIDVYDGNNWTHYSKTDVAERVGSSPDAPTTISPGYVIRNGQRLNEPYIAEDPDYSLQLAPDGSVVLNDPSEPGGVRVNGEIPDVDFIHKYYKARPGQVPPGDVIVMGDNRNDSNDSSRWGPLSEDRLVGRAGFIFYPFSRLGRIH
jgi:signal peptidase I